LKTALTMLPATVGIVVGNGIGMPGAPRLGRRLPVFGLALLVLSSAGMIFMVTRFGTHLTPWELVVPVLVYWAGLGLGSSSLMLITLTGASPQDAGVASGMVNTVVQLGTAAGPATIGTAFFGRLASGAGFMNATGTSLLIGLGLFVVAMAACFLLPRPQAQQNVSLSHVAN
jgi:MFS family permease